ncbi:hypothetical protein PPL_10868 [Heterostelium album PN500]|uniref:GST C-terminal domain-containing protein n=1 Tax=Heterostelium pallidum (strain ATCC 26659 / Pp 5 / PN500) TaxID=670386 RepID=D3BS76_HETP5|nr:hypothetical protein PPL_10868 [Heterostelium album PN500]EFA75813.1 hypothetical protein PPL_10868 [Heterostelium album PN500]|eukprot:XP_020427947.1 hypothetical protein PPL_10868 [Heterostelium album PN500]
MSNNNNINNNNNKPLEFNRETSKFRNWVRVGSDRFPPEANRYHLYANYGCPWVNRVLIVRNLKGLQDVISISITEPRLYEREGWPFNPDFDEFTTDDAVNHAKNIPEIYRLSDATYQGRFSVPVLWDKKNSVIVNNESSEIIRMLNSEFNQFAKNPQLDLVPSDLQVEIDRINELVYENVNNGVYKCGFSPSQEGYDIAFDKLFNTLDELEERLDTNRYLVGDRFTEADVRLFPTLIRFDAAYYVVFKCNLKRIQDYPNLFNYLKELYQMPALQSTINFKHIKNGYYKSKPSLNPTLIVAKGPSTDVLLEPHNRDSKLPIKK